jgi:DNA invertase Pin-like site-specific DNA recombinase
MKTVGYVRVSTLGQVEDGVSLDAQEAKVRAWADLSNASEVVIFRDEGISGKRSDNRPGLQSALDIVGKGDALVVYSLSRLSRSTKDALILSEVLSKKEADLVSLSEKIDTTTAAGKMVFRMLAVLSEFERDQISDRTRFALAHKRSKGEKSGGTFPSVIAWTGDAWSKTKTNRKPSP